MLVYKNILVFSRWVHAYLNKNHECTMIPYTSAEIPRKNAGMKGL